VEAQLVLPERVLRPGRVPQPEQALPEPQPPELLRWEPPQRGPLLLEPLPQAPLGLRSPQERLQRVFAPRQEEVLRRVPQALAGPPEPPRLAVAPA
jgi:hypothetical protein